MNGYVGTILSGSGNTYTVAIAGVGNVTAHPLSTLNSDEKVPAGTSWLFVKSAGSYYFNPATWVG